MTREQAIQEVANDLEHIAREIRKSDTYASHVTESKKDEILASRMHTADMIRRGRYDLSEMWLAQKIHYKLTGEMVAILPK